jgi:tRNA (mo5U34)-methyltransferase
MIDSLFEGRYWYHTIDLPSPGGGRRLTPGEYDHRPYLPRYGFPERLDGETVLDVGSADGFFSFEFERRGAGSVTAVDVPAYPDVPWHEVERFGKGVTRGVTRFDAAKELLGSSVVHRHGSVYDLTPDEFGTYDFVFCGSLLLHLTDPLLALQGLRRVAHDRVIIATAYYHEPLLGLYEKILGTGMRLRKKRTGVKFAALVHTEMDDTYWLPTKAALVEMVERSGFRDVRIHSTFDLNRRDGRRGWPHAVIHAYV